MDTKPFKVGEKNLEIVNKNGKVFPARLIATDRSSPNGFHLLILVNGLYFPFVEAVMFLNNDGRDSYGGFTLRRKPEVEERYVNVYSEGFCPYHASKELAEGSKGSSRQGLIKITFQDKKVISAEVLN